MAAINKWGLICGLILMASVIHQNAVAGSVFLGLETGALDPHMNYKKEFAHRGVVGYRFNRMAVELGVYSFQDFQFGSDDSVSPNTYIELKGNDLQVAYRFDSRIIEFEVAAGTIFWDSKAVFNGYPVGDESGSSLMFDLRAGKSFGTHFRLFVTGKYLHDISGANMTMIAIGARFTF